MHFSSKRMQEKKVQKTEGITLFDHSVVAFTFKGKGIDRGQYRIPFSFRLPLIPGSFRYLDNKGEAIYLQYTLEAYVDNMKDAMTHKKELMVREYYFSDQEIDMDWKDYEQYMNVKKLIKNAAPKMADTLGPQTSMKVSALPSSVGIQR